MPSPIAAAQEALEPVLGGRYRLVRRIATGGMGTVFEAEDLWLHRRVAVKVLRDELVDDTRVRRRFEHEALLAAAVRHRGVAQVHDFVVEPADDGPGRGGRGGGGGGGGGGGRGDRGRAFLVMELVDGEPLSALLRRGERLSIDRSIDIITQAGEALAAAHRCGVVHRDVKPGNILLGDDGRVALTDFGVATSDDPRLDLTAEHGLTYATPSHMSPEQATGGPVGPASDVYSLGIVAHELLTGQSPFHGATPAALAYAHVHTLPPPLPEEVPVHVREAVTAALAKAPVDRPADAAAFVRMLRGTAETRPLGVLAPPSTAGLGAPAEPRPRARRGTLTGAVSVGLAALFATVVIAAGANGGPGDGKDPLTTERPSVGSTATTAPSTAAPTVLTVATTAPPTEPAAAPAAKAGGKGHAKGKDKRKG